MWEFSLRDFCVVDILEIFEGRQLQLQVEFKTSPFVMRPT